MTLLTDLASDIAGEHCFFDESSGFAVDATYLGADLRLIFDNDYSEFDSGEVPIAGSQPRAWVRTAEAPAIDGTVTISGAAYTVRNIEADNNGVSMLVLHRSATP